MWGEFMLNAERLKVNDKWICKILNDKYIDIQTFLFLQKKKEVKFLLKSLHSDMFRLKLAQIP